MNASHYHVTTLEPDHRPYVEKAKTQDEMVLEFFNKWHSSKFTPVQVWEILFKKTAPLTSVRRAITNLERREKLKKHTETKEGLYGRPNHTWSLVTPPQPVQLSLFDYSRIDNQVGCGYCKHEKTCEIRDPKINKARLGCEMFIHHQAGR